MALKLQLSETHVEELDDSSEGATPQPITELPLHNPYSGRNRRFVPRVTGHFVVLGRAGAEFTGIDLSVGGMLCHAPEPVWPGNELWLELELGRHSALVRGRVVEFVSCQGEIAMRIRFLEVGPDTRRAIASWMATSGTPRIG